MHYHIVALMPTASPHEYLGPLDLGKPPQFREERHPGPLETCPRCHPYRRLFSPQAKSQTSETEPNATESRPMKPSE